MFVKKTAEIGGKSISIETGRLARLAHGSAVVTLGESIVLSTVCTAEPRPGIDFFPLTIEYREKTYAAGASIEMAERYYVHVSRSRGQGHEV